MMNFGIDDMINNTVFGIPKENLRDETDKLKKKNNNVNKTENDSSQVYIENFPMPDNCFVCPFLIKSANYPRCMLDKLIGRDRHGKWEDIREKRMDWCMLKTAKEENR